MENPPTISVRLGERLDSLEAVFILATLEMLDGNRTKTAAMLAISPKTLRSRLARYKMLGYDVPPTDKELQCRGKTEKEST